MPGENLPRRVWNRQTKLTYNHWLAALVKGKCSSTKPTHLATGVTCHPDTEQNRPYKIPWSCRGLNRGPTAPQARTLPVCHTTPYKSYRPIPGAFGTVTFYLLRNKVLNCLHTIFPSFHFHSSASNTTFTLPLSFWAILNDTFGNFNLIHHQINITM